ncbi:acetyltransferase [Paenibacillus abyssi]|uniref:Acetyltransferase EpsM n=1 Tax=Paenibacillus abyssi TaxID=1340531 RepID=A0A917CX29_9BACL|nr:acetyltransferase [Paenibacillus abyssi]GGF98513.1 putative acetyltransferase EpsM [Paenibacillus abyssi]
MSKTPLLIVGAGGHGRVVRDLLQTTKSYWLALVADDKLSHTELRDGVYYGPVALMRDLIANETDAAAAVIGIGDNRIRREMSIRLELPDKRYAALIHPEASVAKDAVIGHGAVVMAGAIVNTGAVIGPHAIVNSGAVVEHDCTVGAFAHISPRVALAGGVRVMEGAHVGIGACVIQGISIGRWSILGAGAAAIADVPDGVTAVGVPARVIKQQTMQQPHLTNQDIYPKFTENSEISLLRNI